MALYVSILPSGGSPVACFHVVLGGFSEPSMYIVLIMDAPVSKCGEAK
jgi:hypothetical protein